MISSVESSQFPAYLTLGLNEVGNLHQIVELGTFDLNPEVGGRMSQSDVAVGSDSKPGKGSVHVPI